MWILGYVFSYGYSILGISIGLWGVIYLLKNREELCNELNLQYIIQLFISVYVLCIGVGNILGMILDGTHLGFSVSVMGLLGIVIFSINIYLNGKYEILYGKLGNVAYIMNIYLIVNCITVMV